MKEHIKRGHVGEHVLRVGRDYIEYLRRFLEVEELLVQIGALREEVVKVEVQWALVRYALVEESGHGSDIGECPNVVHRLRRTEIDGGGLRSLVGFHGSRSVWRRRRNLLHLGSPSLSLWQQLIITKQFTVTINIKKKKEEERETQSLLKWWILFWKLKKEQTKNVPALLSVLKKRKRKTSCEENYRESV